MFSLRHKGAERREFTECWDASDLFPWKPDIGFPEGRDFYFLFEKKECRNRAPSHYSLEGNFYEFSPHVHTKLLPFSHWGKEFEKFLRGSCQCRDSYRGKWFFGSNLSHRKIRFFLWLTEDLTCRGKGYLLGTGYSKGLIMTLLCAFLPRVMSSQHTGEAILKSGDDPRMPELPPPSHQPSVSPCVHSSPSLLVPCLYLWGRIVFIEIWLGLKAVFLEMTKMNWRQW